MKTTLCIPVSVLTTNYPALSGYSFGAVRRRARLSRRAAKRIAMAVQRMYGFPCRVFAHGEERLIVAEAPREWGQASTAW